MKKLVTLHYQYQVNSKIIFQYIKLEIKLQMNWKKSENKN